MSEEKLMRLKASTFIDRMAVSAVLVVTLMCASAVFSIAAQQSKQPAAAAPAGQKGFSTAKEAADALIKASENYDVAALKEIFGPDGEDLVSSEDPVQDKNRSQAFFAMAKEKQSLTKDASNSNRVTLVVGNEDWPLPIPIVKKEGKWYFDSKAGHDEILYRRIGTNELNAIEVCRGFVEAQKEYASKVHDDSGINQYAQRLISTPGKQDGLYWEDKDGTPAGPVSKGVAQAIDKGYTLDKGSVYSGYYFRLLKGQGPAAPLGELDYMIKGMMIGGFALVAFPAEYKVTGVKTFIVSHDGIVYEKDLGPDTLNVAKAMERYNPDKTWHRTDDQW